MEGPDISVDDVIVSVIDTGVNYRYPDLSNQMWFNPKDIPNNNIDDDGNGYIDDVHVSASSFAVPVYICCNAMRKI